MSGMRQRNNRQSDLPSEDRPSQRRGRASSPNYELPHDEAMETIDWLVLFARGATGPQGQLLVNVSREGLKEYMVFPGSDDSSRVVCASVIETRNEGWFIDELVFFSSQGREDGKLLDMRAKLVIRQALKWIGRPSSSYTSTTLVLLALAQVDPQSLNLKPDWYAWISEQISLRLNHTKEDRANIAKFWEGWQAVVQLLCTKFLQDWRGRMKKLKEDLLKAQDVLADVAQREEALQAEHERLQEEYSQEKAA
ncbi:hypothetical protein R1flu_021615 [Riccia fluitans]|uniref:Uncharacterized protein n=1 Tax=Riccia fluitans TaxID=41844 RepID=A0ABD1ZQH3_9MARC